MRKFFIAFLILFLGMTNYKSVAQDRVFAYMYGSNNLNKGMKDLEVWNTFHIGRDYLYRKLQSRFEFEVGLSNRLQTSFYLNLKQEYSAPDSIAVLSTTELSFSNAWKVKISDAVANAIGSSVYAEYYVSPSEFELEAKVILDKRMGPHYIDFNGVYENAWEWERDQEEKGGYDTKTEVESKFEFDLGYMYFLKRNWGIGLELRNHNVMQEGSLNYSALFAGPTLSYSADQWWLVFNILPQISKLKSINPEDSWRDLTEHEMIQFRLIFAYNL